MSEELRTVQVEKLNRRAQMPHRVHEGDAGADLAALDSIVIHPGSTELVRTGLVVHIPRGYEGQIRSRSGLGGRYGITVAQGVGTIDHGYTGEVLVALHNRTDVPYEVQEGRRIAQLVIAQVPTPQFVEVDSTAEEPTKAQQTLQQGRGRGGFGSTGA